MDDDGRNGGVRVEAEAHEENQWRRIEMFVEWRSEAMDEGEEGQQVGEQQNMVAARIRQAEQMEKRCEEVGTCLYLEGDCQECERGRWKDRLN